MLEGVVSSNKSHRLLFSHVSEVTGKKLLEREFVATSGSPVKYAIYLVTQPGASSVQY